MGEIIGTSLLVLPLILIMLHGTLIGINHLVLQWKYKKAPECDCPLPKSANYGDLFICPECAWAHQYDYDDFSSGWYWMTWQTHLRYRLGIYPQEKMREPDPLPTVGVGVENNLQQRAKLVAKAIRQAVQK